MVPNTSERSKKKVDICCFLKKTVYCNTFFDMFEYLKEAYKALPLRFKRIVIALLAAAASITAIASLSSCSRSTLLFKGSGDIEYYYKGSTADPLPHTLNQQ